MDVSIPEAYEELFRQHRYKVFYGGRGSGKSWACATALILLGWQRPLRILCAREIQRSISDSVHKLLTQQIDDLGLTSFFIVTREAIRGINGTEIVFKGLRTNTQEIKSMEGVDICWVEEAQAVSQDSWDVLIPTIRKDGSEIWITFNPMDEQDPTYQRFVAHPPMDAVIRKVNYDENPYFPDVLRGEMEWLKQKDYQSYLHIWEGEVRKFSNALVFGNYFRVESFDTPRETRFYHGADWGFACLDGDTMVLTEHGEKPIRDIKTGDMVMTRDGLKRVIHAQSRGVKPVYDVSIGGHHIIATGDHRIFTAGGWKQVCDLEEIEECVVIQSSLTEKFINAIRRASIRITTTIGHAIRQRSITGHCGNTTMGKSLMDMSSTTSMGILSTTGSITLPASLQANIAESITRTTLVESLRKRWQSCVRGLAIAKRIGRSAGRRLWQRLKREEESARNAENPTLSQTCIKSFARLIAGSIAMQEMLRKNISAKCAEIDLWHPLTHGGKPVLQSALIDSTLLKDEREVFDITVENGEYFANGVLVHNCDPTILVRCFIDGRKLYIDQEAWGVGVEIDKTPALFDKIETSRKWAIKADCARPETISYMRRQGFNISPAKKWQGSVEDGIEFLKTFDIVVHPRCKHTIDEFNHYSYKVDKQTNDILPTIVDANNHIIDGLRYSLDGLIKGHGQMKIDTKALSRLKIRPR
jgi:phage terminase large subunit